MSETPSPLDQGQSPGSMFRAMHRPGQPFVLANAWDIGSARLMAGLGAEAIGTSSAAHAFTLGRPDMGGVTRDEALAHAEALVAATPLPVSGDFENGFGREPEVVAETVRMAADAGLAGISIEDTDLPDTGAYELSLAVERIEAAVAAARALPDDFVLLARADGVMNSAYDFEEGLRRLVAFEEAGADALYMPALASLDDLRRVCTTVTKPVNALPVGRLAVDRQTLAEAGAARISLGSTLASLAQQAIAEGIRSVLDGDLSVLQGGLPDSEVDRLLAAGAEAS